MSRVLGRWVFDMSHKAKTLLLHMVAALAGAGIIWLLVEVWG